MTRKDFIEQVGGSAAGLFFVACAASCKKSSTSSSTTPQGPSNVNFTVDVSSGPLSANGGYVVQSGVIVARTSTGTFLAVAAACTHQGTNVQYVMNANDFLCPNHGSKFDTSGNVLQGPAAAPLKKYNTSLSGTTLTVTG